MIKFNYKLENPNLTLRQGVGWYLYDYVFSIYILGIKVKEFKILQYPVDLREAIETIKEDDSDYDN